MLRRSFAVRSESFALDDNKERFTEHGYGEPSLRA